MWICLKNASVVSGALSSVTRRSNLPIIRYVTTNLIISCVAAKFKNHIVQTDRFRNKKEDSI